LAEWHLSYAGPDAPGEWQEIASDNNIAYARKDVDEYRLPLKEPGAYQVRLIAYDEDGQAYEDLVEFVLTQ
jgi:hypothetical protein